MKRIRNIPKSTALIFIFSVALSLNTASMAVAKSEPIIDAHVHLDFEQKQDQISGIPYTKAEFMKETAEAGVTGFVAHTSSDEMPIPDMDGLTPTFCVGVHEEVKLSVVEAGLKSGKYKCIKIYLGYAYKYPYDESYKPLYKLAEQMNVPVVFHTGDTSTKDAKVKYSHPLAIDEVAVDFPRTTFVIAHVGNPWFRSAAEVAYKNDNVYVDASGIMIGDLTKYKNEDFKKYIIEPVSWVFGYIDNSKKMMFGTDWPLVNIKQYLNIVQRAIPPADRRAFLHDNAVRVFHIQEK